MVEKRCLSCGNFTPDDLDLEGEPLPLTSFSAYGVCKKQVKRIRESWACGYGWIARAIEGGQGR